MYDKSNSVFVNFGFADYGNKLIDRWVSTTSSILPHVPIGHFTEEDLERGRSSDEYLAKIENPSFEIVLSLAIQERLLKDGKAMPEVEAAQQSLRSALDALGAISSLGIPVTIGISSEVEEDGNHDLPEFVLRAVRSREVSD